MKKHILPLTLFFLALTSTAQTKKDKDRAAIKTLCGCYEIEFNFAETFSYSDDSLYTPSPVKIAYALEWVDLTYEDQNNFILQHILQMGNDSNAYIIKHWREDWAFQDKKMLAYISDNKWKNKILTHKEKNGKWTQKVFQVDDSPRYEGVATWVHVDGKSYWENIADAPLPRRERTIRSDYNILKRENRVQITDYGWVHKQDNLKILRSDKFEDKIIAREYGYSPYKKVDDSKCIHARNWWKKNSGKWEKVRKVWGEIFEENNILELKKVVDDKKLWEYLFSDEYQDEDEIRSVINKFILN
tara:strand:+ start:12606 stop:13508 length:903 start_codon:yes stop_codon:yes gene_type:complete